MGKIRGTPCMWRHISAHRATTKCFSNSFVFKTKIEKEGLPGDSPAGLGAGGPEFKSRRPDHLLLCFQCTVPDTAASEIQCLAGVQLRFRSGANFSPCGTCLIVKANAWLPPGVQRSSCFRPHRVDSRAA